MTVSTSGTDNRQRAGPIPLQGIASLPASEFFDGSPVAMFAIDMSHAVTHINRACAVTLGVSAEDVIGSKTLGRIFYGHDRPLLADLIVDGSLGENLERFYQKRYSRSPIIPDAFEAEGFFPALGNRGLWLFFTAAPLRDAKGRIVGAIETLRDITARKRVEQNLLEAQGALNKKLMAVEGHLLQSEKLASIGLLAAGVAHEIASPTGCIVSNFAILDRHLVKLFEMLTAYQEAEPSHADEQTVAQLKSLREQIELQLLKEDIPVLMRECRADIGRVQKIVRDLNDFSHVDANPKWQLANLTAGIRSALNLIGNDVKIKADLVTYFAELPDVWCLASEINQVILNLVANAAESIGPERGRITVRTGLEGDAVWIEVSDTGAGIPQENMPRIFDPFYTTKAAGKGKGLGLSLSYGIVRKHYGRIEVQSEVGTGTHFRVTLPIEQPDSKVTMAATLN